MTRVKYGRMAELVDALASGASVRKNMEVQVLFRPPTMKTVAICASKRYAKKVDQFCDQLEKLGVVCYKPNFHESHPDEHDAFSDYHEEIHKVIFKGLTLEHFDWIRKADICFIYNEKDYAGISVSLEMGFASALSKPIYALTPKTGDPCRDALIDRVVNTPKKLAKLL
jgi:hypothetical protein